MNDEQFKQALIRTAEMAGFNITKQSDLACAQLLAWVYAFGGGVEATVINERMNLDIFAAQARFNIDGGEVPNQKLMPLLHAALKEVEPYMKHDKDFVAPDWAITICEKYNINKNAVK